MKNKDLTTADTQVARLYRWLMSGKTISALECWQHLGIARLAARIYDLKKRGFNIKTKRVQVLNRFQEECTVAEYHMGETPF